MVHGFEPSEVGKLRYAILLESEGRVPTVPCVVSYSALHSEGSKERLLTFRIFYITFCTLPLYVLSI